MDYSKLKTADIIHLNNKELSEYIYSIQDQLQMKLSSGLSIDDIISPDGTYLKVPKNVIMELKYPSLDMIGSTV